MKVRDRMTPKPYTVSPDSSVGEAWKLMKEHNLTRLPVLDREKLLGIITQKDFGAHPDLDFRGTSVATRYFATEKENVLNRVKVRDVMPTNQELVTIDPDAYIEMAAILLKDNKISGLPVVDTNGKLVGIITQTDIFGAFLDLLAINRKGSRINLRIKDDPETLIKIGEILSKYHVHVQNLVTMEILNEDYLMILRINTTESKAIVNDFKAAGFKVESTLVKK
jgi:acetoin utilization protein AcuB